MSDLSIQSQLQVARAQSAQTPAGAMTQAEGEAFAQMLAQEMSVMQGAQAGTSAANASPLAAYTPALMTATAGQGLEAQILMLLMMMTTGQADVSAMMAVLAQAVGDMEDEQETETLRRTVMDSSYENELLDEVNEVVFQGVHENYPYEAWKATSPQITNGEGTRSAAAYSEVIAQFGVATNPRYQNDKRGMGDTYCNIFLWDVTSAMGAEIPHYIDPDTGEPRSYPDVKGARELNANATYNWLRDHGERYGWIEVSAAQAQAHANAGGPAITAWHNPTGRPGHVQVVRPELAGTEFDEARGVAVAQAGSKRLEYAHAGDIFSDNAMDTLKYYIHQ